MYGWYLALSQHFLALSQHFCWRLLLSSCPSVCLSVCKQIHCEHTQGYNFFTNSNCIWHTVSNKVWDCKWVISDQRQCPNWQIPYSPPSYMDVFGKQLVWIVINLIIVNKPYLIRENGPAGLRKYHISPLINIT